MSVKKINERIRASGIRQQNMRKPLDLTVAENKPFDLVFSEISLPDGDVLELLHIQAMRAFIPGGDCK